MNPIQIDDWRIYRRDGEQFLHTAQAAHAKRKKTFTAETLYNLTCMGIEKLIMAFLMNRGVLAENHTMHDLARALGNHLDAGSNVDNGLRYLDSFQEICDPDEIHLRRPDKEDIQRILDIGSEIHELLTPHLER